MKKNLLLALSSVIITCIFISSCSEEEIKYKRYYSDGLHIYKNRCQSCHMVDGTGLRGIIPPLTDTAFLRKNRKNLACYMAFGLNDTIIVEGITYNTPMPAEKNLAPIDIAKVLTYITNTFGNQQGIYDVTEVEHNMNNVCK